MATKDHGEAPGQMRDAGLAIKYLRAEVARLHEDAEASAQEKAADWLDIAADTIDPAGVYRHLKQQAAILRESVKEHRDARADAAPPTKDPTP